MGEAAMVRIVRLNARVLFVCSVFRRNRVVRLIYPTGSKWCY